MLVKPSIRRPGGVINDALLPTAEEPERAADVLDLAAEAGGGACVDENGWTIDGAVLRFARWLIEGQRSAVGAMGQASRASKR